jgi:hypothetical protein
LKGLALALWNENVIMEFARDRAINEDVPNLYLQADTRNGYTLLLTSADPNSPYSYDVRWNRPAGESTASATYVRRYFNNSTTSTSGGSVTWSSTHGAYRTSATSATGPLTGILVYPTLTDYNNNTNPVVSWGTVPAFAGIRDFPANPDRRLQATGQCINAAGNIIDAFPSYSREYTDYRAVPPVSNPGCPPDYALRSITVREQVQATSTNWTEGTVVLNAFWDPEFEEEHRDALPGNGGEVTPGTTPENCSWDGTTGCLTQADFEEQPTTTPTTVTLPPETMYTGDGTGCAPSGWELLNPAAYIAATSCLFQWAFIPQNIDQYNSNIIDAFEGSTLGQLFEVAGDIIAPIADIDTETAPDCMGPLVTIPVPDIYAQDDVDMYPFQACSDLGQTLSSIALAATNFTLVTGFVILGGQQLLGAFGLYTNFRAAQEANERRKNPY